MLSREAPSHLESGHAQSLLVHKGYEYQATLSQLVWAGTRALHSGVTSSPEAQIGPSVVLLAHPQQLLWGEHNPCSPSLLDNAQSALTSPPGQAALARGSQSQSKLSSWNGNAALVGV